MVRPPSSEQSEQLGPYRLLRELGRGGQAVVWLAEDTRIGRRVALKVLPAMGPSSAAVLARFRREAEVTSRLEHPAICPIYEADLTGGVPFIAMRLVEGETLAQCLAKRSHVQGGGASAGQPLSDWQSIATFFAKTARALHLAHEAGVVHRDIKPANLMITSQGEPVILDFGLARQDDPESQALSMSAQMSGTPTYMSPEQMTGRTPADRRSDVYSLGCTLFECLSGRPPFEAPTLEALIGAVLHQDTPDVRRRNAAVPADLAVITTTATAKERERRYLTALDLALELERFVRREPIAARPITGLQRALRWCQRNPALAGSIATIVLLLLGAAGLLSYGLGAAGRADLEGQLREQADKQRDLAEAARQAQLRSDADRTLAGRLDELQMRLGTLTYGIRGGAAGVASLLPAFAAVLRQAGLDPNAADAVDRGKAMVERMRALDGDAGRALLDAIRTMAQAEHETEAARGKLSQIVAAFEDPRLTDYRAAEQSWLREKVDRFGPLLTEQKLNGCDVDQLTEIAYILAGVQGREDETLALLDRALLLRPNSFALHYQRAGMGLGRASVGMGLESKGPSIAAASKAIEHFRAAMALRPNSGLARSAMAGAMALHAFLSNDSAGFEPAWRVLESATKVEPDNALVWYLRADFLRHTPGGRSRAIEACRKALQLDAQLMPAQALLQELDK